MVFRSTDQIDIFVSNLFFTETDCAEAVDGTRCGKFLLNRHPVWRFVRESGHNLPLLLMAASCLYLIWLLMFNTTKTRDQLTAPLAALLSGLAGPLIAVNLVLKEYWGRPRPVQTSFFGGDHPYVAPGDISSYCDTNCSFVSGEAAAAFWMLILVFYLKGRKRVWCAALLLPLAGFIAMLRVAFGRHYISDVVMAALLVMFLSALSIWLLQTARGQNWMTGLHRYSNKNAFGRKNAQNS
ncbi:MAG: phosphatase PAP2 family protein [Rhizobiaceae bacterium]